MPEGLASLQKQIISAGADPSRQQIRRMLKHNSEADRPQKEYKVRHRMAFGKSVFGHKIPPFKKRKVPENGDFWRTNYTRTDHPKSPSFRLQGCIPARDALLQMPSRNQSMAAAAYCHSTAAWYRWDIPIPISLETFCMDFLLVYHRSGNYAMTKGEKTVFTKKPRRGKV